MMKSSETTPEKAKTPESRLSPYLHLLVFSALAIAQPILNLVGRFPEFLVVRGLSALDVALFLVSLLLLVPLPAVILECLAGIANRRFQRGLHAFFVWGLSTAIGTQALKSLGHGYGLRAVAAAAALAALTTAAYLRFRPLRLLATYAAIALIAVPAAFVMRPQVLRVLRPPPEASRAFPPTGAEIPIVMVVFDELAYTSLLAADRRIDRARFPNLAALADEASWFENAATVSHSTHLAVPALLSGRYPRAGDLPMTADYPANLFTLFSGDYEIRASEPVTRLCPSGLNQLASNLPSLAQRFSLLFEDIGVVYLHLTLPGRYSAALPPITQGWADFARLGGPSPQPHRSSIDEGQARPEMRDFVRLVAKAARDRRADFLRLVGSLDDVGDRSLYFLHALLPHTPFEYLPSGKSYLAHGGHPRPPGLMRGLWENKPLRVAQTARLYQLQVESVDLLVGELIDRLRKTGVYDRALIVLVADHGVSFRPGQPYRILTPDNAGDLVPVPLLIKRPGQRQGEIVTTAVTLIDVLPTILEIAGVPIPDSVEGRSVFSTEGGPREPGRVIHSGFRVWEYGPELHRNKYDSLARRLETLGPGPYGESRIEQLPALAGRAISGMRTETLPGLGLVLYDQERWSFVEPDDPDVSAALVQGALTLPKPDPECCDVAIAVNGRIEASTRTFGVAGRRHRFSALLPEGVLRAASNSVEAFVVRNGASVQLLAPEELSLSHGDLEVDSAGKLVAVLSGTKRVPLVRQRLRGHIGRFDRDKAGFVISGRVFDAETGEIPSQLLLVFNDRVIATTKPSELVSDHAVRRRNKNRARARFRFEVPRADLREVRWLGIRVFAITRDGKAASELKAIYNLVEKGSGKGRIGGTDGKVLRLASGPSSPAFQLRREEGKGWKVDLTLDSSLNRGAPSRALIFLGDRFVTEIEPPFHREEASKDGRAQFRAVFRLPASATKKGEDPAPRIFLVWPSGSVWEAQQSYPGQEPKE